MSEKKNIKQTILQKIWSLFFSGLLITLPITLTLALFSFSFRLIIHWLQPLKNIASTTPILNLIPYPEMLLALVIIFSAGIIYNIFILRTIINTVESLVTSLPIIRPIYSGIKKLIEAFSIHDQISFKQVVLIEFPRPGIYSTGFLTSKLSKQLSPIETKTYCNIFIPTTPNPTSGYFVIVPEEDITIIPISVQDAMTMIISGGIIQPELTHNVFDKSKNKLI